MFNKEKTISNGGVPSTATLTSHSDYWLVGYDYSFIYTDDNSTAASNTEGTYTVDTNREIALKMERIPIGFPDVGDMVIDTSKENKGVVINGTYRFVVIETNASIFWTATGGGVVGGGGVVVG